MSVNTVNGFTPGQKPAQPSQSSQPLGAEQDITAQLFGWSDIQQSIFGANINTTLGSSFVLNAMKMFEKQLPVIAAQASKIYDIELLRMDADTYPTLPCTIIVLSVTFKEHKEKIVAYRPILVEATYDEANNIATQDLNGLQVEVLRLASNSYGPHQQRAVNDLIAKRYAGYNLRPVSQVVLARDFDILNEATSTEFLSKTVMTTVSLLNSAQENWTDVSLANIAGDKALVTRVRFVSNDEPIINADSLPVRSDVRFTLATHRDNQSDTKSISISEAAGYMDLVYVGSPQQFNPAYGMYQKEPPFMGRFNLTTLNTKRIPTLGGALLAIGSSLSAYQQNIGMMSLFPNRASNVVIDPRDIGILNLEANINNEQTPSPIEDIRSSKTSDADIYAYMSRVIRPTFQLTMEILDSNSESAMYAPLLAAARGVPEARLDVLRSADALTGGHMGRKGWLTNNHPIATISSVIPVGDYAPNGSRESGRRDTRDCDLLVVMNAFGTKDYSQVRRWSNARLDPNMPWQLRLAEQRTIINAILSEVIFRDVATQILFDSRFLADLSEGLSSAGVSMQVIAPTQRVTDSRYIPTHIAAYDPVAISGSLFSGGNGQVDNRNYIYGAGFAYQPMASASAYR